MDKRTGMIIFALASLLMTTAFFQGCGVKADPVPPEVIRLKPASDLDVKLAGSAMLLRWSLPGEASPITRFRIFRSEMEAEGADCPDCPRKHVLLVELDAGDARVQKEDGGKFTYSDATVRPGHLYSYYIVGCNR